VSIYGREVARGPQPDIANSEGIEYNTDCSELGICEVTEIAASRKKMGATMIGFVCRRLLRPFIDCVYLAFVGCACVSLSAAAVDAADQINPSLLHEAQTNFQPLPKDAGTAEFPVTEERTRLGRLLYFDPRLTIDANMSCGSCHLPSFYGSNPLTACVGARRQPCSRNVPTTLNAALAFANNWLGNRVNIEDQATQGLTNPVGSGLDEDAVMDRVKQIAGYEPLFRAAFPDDPQPLTLKNMGTAIGAYERTLLTPSRFDTFLAGDINALSERELPEVYDNRLRDLSQRSWNWWRVPAKVWCDGGLLESDGQR
jgi:hypothetical protein